MMKPIALTCGDPSGIGLEIALKAWSEIGDELSFFLISDPKYTQALANELGVKTQVIGDVSKIDATSGGLPILPISFAKPPDVGRECPANAPAVIKSIEVAVNLVKSDQASALCTLPINKKVLKDGAEFAHPGHTEFLAQLGDVDQSFMMLLAPELKVVPVTIHIALSQVPSALTPTLLADTLQATHQALQRDFDVAKPRLAVAGLNPHAGEGGTMGREELDMMNKVLNQLRESGMQITGPMPADTMFHPQARAQYDAAVCMYHDQALIPLKTLNFSQGVNATLGLPFIRTSPDHGTAFDIAGKGIADPSSLVAALRTASQMVENRARYDA